MTQPQPRKLRLAFLGGAYESAVGRVHRTAVEMDQRFQLVAGCFSRHAETNRSSALRYGVAPGRTHASLDALLEREAKSIDAIVILTPTDQHEPQVRRCLEAGVPVVCEKALATSRDEGAALRAAMQRHGGFLAVTYNYTGYPMVRELKQVIEQGRLGRIQQVHVEMPQEGFERLGKDGRPVVPQSWRLHDNAIPTISLDLGVHLHMMVRFLTGARPVELVATSDTYGNFGEVVDNVALIARYTDRLHCSVWYSKTALGQRNGLRVRVFGTAGSAEWLQEDAEHLWLADNRGARVLFDRASGDAQVSNQPRYTRFKAGHPAGFIEAFANYYCDTADVLEAYLRDGRQPAHPYVFGLDETLEGLHMLQAAAESASTRRWVRLE